MLSMKKKVCWLILALVASGRASAQDLPRGQIIDDVPCEGDDSQHYALYLPSNFTLERQWPVILVFDPGARGRIGVERYQAAAEKYGYIVAGSNNSRNGSVQVSLNAAMAMAADLDNRFFFVSQANVHGRHVGRRARRDAAGAEL
jgi:hypothetical protein